MNNLENIYKKEKNASGFIKSYLNYLTQLIDKLKVREITEFIDELEKAKNNNNTIFVIGNGGSAATASHIGNDIGMATLKVESEEKPFKILPLTDNFSIISAIGNDYGYDNIFLKQLNIHYRPNDVLIVISASGNSPNLITAANFVKGKGGRVLGMLGFNGGKLLKLCDSAVTVKTPKGEYAPVEDIHMILDHVIVTWLQMKYQIK